MADDESTNAEDNTVEAVEPEAPAQVEDTKESEDDSDVDLEDIEVNLEDIEDKEESETESEPEEKEEAESTPDEESDEEEEAEPETEESKADAQKRFNNEQAQKRIDEKRVRELQQKEAQQEYLDDADPDRPEDLALRQLQVDAYNNKVEGNTNKLTNGYERAIKDFEIFKDPSPEIQAELDQALDAFQAMHVTVDAYGNPTEVREDLYKHLQSKAESIAKLTGIGARQQAKSKTKEKSKTFTPPNRTPKEPKKDPDLEAFDEEARKY